MEAKRHFIYFYFSTLFTQQYMGTGFAPSHLSVCVGVRFSCVGAALIHLFFSWAVSFIINKGLTGNVSRAAVASFMHLTHEGAAWHVLACPGDGDVVGGWARNPVEHLKYTCGLPLGLVHLSG